MAELGARSSLVKCLHGQQAFYFNGLVACFADASH
jgi:hypothetical protein